MVADSETVVAALSTYLQHSFESVRKLASEMWWNFIHYGGFKLLSSSQINELARTLGASLLNSKKNTIKRTILLSLCCLFFAPDSSK